MSDRETPDLLRELFRCPGLLDERISESDPQGERRFNAGDIFVAARNGFVAGMEHAADILDEKHRGQFYGR